MNEPFNPEVLAPLSFLPKILAGGILRSLGHSINRRCKVLSAQLSSQPPYKPEIPPHSFTHPTKRKYSSVELNSPYKQEVLCRLLQRLGIPSWYSPGENCNATTKTSTKMSACVFSLIHLYTVNPLF